MPGCQVGLRKTSLSVSRAACARNSSWRGSWPPSRRRRWRRGRGTGRSPSRRRLRPIPPTARRSRRRGSSCARRGSRRRRRRGRRRAAPAAGRRSASPRHPSARPRLRRCRGPTIRCHCASGCIVVPNAPAVSAHEHPLVVDLGARVAERAPTPCRAARREAAARLPDRPVPRRGVEDPRVRGETARHDAVHGRGPARSVVEPLPEPVAGRDVRRPLHRAQRYPARAGRSPQARRGVRRRLGTGAHPVVEDRGVRHATSTRRRPMEPRNPDDLDALRAASDVLGIDALLSDDERAVRDRVRALRRRAHPPAHRRLVRPGVFPAELAPELGELGVLGMTLDGYGCPGRSAVEYGLAALELEAGDSGIRTFVSVQGSLAMGSIHRWGSEEQKQEWLPRMARGEVDRLLRPHRADAGLRPVEHEDVRAARRRRLDPQRIEALDRARLDRAARGRLGADRRRRARLPRADGRAGVRARRVLEPKGSMRASVQCELHFDDVRLPAIRAAAGRARSARAVLRAERGALRHRLGRARRRARQLRGGAAARAAARAVRSADRGVPADAAEARRTWWSSCRRARCSRCTSDG